MASRHGTATVAGAFCSLEGSYMPNQRTKLETYRAKRDFSKTGEPKGRLMTASVETRRFVIQKHAASRLHYDLRLEVGGVFKSWAVTKGPSLNPADKRLAVEVEDHPIDYGDFEGTIPKGQYGGGTVMLWDRGTWDTPANDPAKSLRKGELKFMLHGEKINGGWVIVRLARNRDGDKRTNWLLIKRRDNYASEAEVTAKDKSVASGRAMEEIEAGRGKGPKPFINKTTRRAPAKARWQSGKPMAKRSPSKGVAGASKRQSARKPRTTRKRSGVRRVAKARKATQDEAPAFIPPQLCRLVDRPPGGGDWVSRSKV
jgi:bifunctional non-homologous end joining protein LigD